MLSSVSRAQGWGTMVQGDPALSLFHRHRGGSPVRGFGPSVHLPRQFRGAPQTAPAGMVDRQRGPSSFPHPPIPPGPHSPEPGAEPAPLLPLGHPWREAGTAWLGHLRLLPEWADGCRRELLPRSAGGEPVGPHRAAAVSQGTCMGSSSPLSLNAWSPSSVHLQQQAHASLSPDPPPGLGQAGGTDVFVFYAGPGLSSTSFTRPWWPGHLCWTLRSVRTPPGETLRPHSAHPFLLSWLPKPFPSNSWYPIFKGLILG